MTRFAYNKVRDCLAESSDEVQWGKGSIHEADGLMDLFLFEVGARAADHCLKDDRKRVTKEDLVAGFNAWMTDFTVSK